MAVYEYLAFDSGGKRRQGVVDADSPQAARRKLRDTGLLPTELNESREAATAVQGKDIQIGRAFRGSMRTDLALSTRQLAVLLEAGMPLAESLKAIIEQLENPRLLKVLFDVRDRLTAGSTFADALSIHPKVFDSIYINMVRAGESSGALQPILMRMADFMENQVRLQKKVRSSLAYPILMALMGVGVVIFLMTGVIPKVAQIFADLGKALPTTTEILINACDILRLYWWAILLVGLLLFATFRAYVKTPKGRMVWDGVKLKTPLFGDLIRKTAVARFARTLGTLGESGLPMMLSLDIVKRIVNNKVLEEVIENAKVQIRKGSDLAAPLRKDKVFPPIVIHMISLGERSGKLDQMLIKVADNYEEEVELSIASLVSLLEPVMILSMGLVVGFLVFAILLPIFQLSQTAF